MAEIVYILCALTSATCAVMLYRGYKRSGVTLLFWSCLCFLGIGLSNAILVIDLLVLPGQDLSMIRTVPALIGLLILIYGLIWETA
jgi:hypothetical protein